MEGNQQGVGIIIAGESYDYDNMPTIMPTIYGLLIAQRSYQQMRARIHELKKLQEKSIKKLMNILPDDLQINLSVLDDLELTAIEWYLKILDNAHVKIKGFVENNNAFFTYKFGSCGEPSSDTTIIDKFNGLLINCEVPQPQAKDLIEIKMTVFLNFEHSRHSLENLTPPPSIFDK